MAGESACPAGAWEDVEMNSRDRRRLRRQQKGNRGTKGNYSPFASRGTDSDRFKRPWYRTVWGALAALGLTSITGLVGLWIAFVTLLPDLAIDPVVDLSQEEKALSRVSIRNVGALPALSIHGDAYLQKVRIGNASIGGFTLADVVRIPRLASGESTQFSVAPGFSVDEKLTEVKEFKYDLTLHYNAELLFIERTYSKAWAVELVTHADAYDWNIHILAAPEPRTR